MGEHELSSRTAIPPDNPVLSLRSARRNICQRQPFVLPVVPFVKPRRRLDQRLRGAALRPRQRTNCLALIIPVEKALFTLDAKLKDLDSSFGSLLWADVARRHPN